MIHMFITYYCMCLYGLTVCSEVLTSWGEAQKTESAGASGAGTWRTIHIQLMVDEARTVCRDNGVTLLKLSTNMSQHMTMHYSFECVCVVS